LKSDSGLLTRALLVAGAVLISVAVFASDDSTQPTPPSSRASAVRSAANPAADPQSQTSETVDSEPCHWWQFRRCSQEQQQQETSDDILPPEAPRTGPVIAVDISKRTAYLFFDGQLVEESPAAVGSGKVLVHGDDEWAFHTPEGHLIVRAKIVDPVWHKPDWAFIEVGQRIPPADSPRRDVRGHLGKYALSLGDGILIHGTDDPSSIGRAVSHGCIRLPEKMLATVYHSAKVGTDVYIFESDPRQEVSGAEPEHHSDLDYLKKN
jgi:lipoprotein-anchoring transpeptidase ErfK/SrfK